MTADPLEKASDRPLLRYLSNLEKAAREKPTAAAYLRLARLDAVGSSAA